MKQKQRMPLDNHSSFKRYCEYQAFQSLNNSRDLDHDRQVQTQIIMFPPPAEHRSKTAFGTRVLAFKNIGENIQERRPKLGQRNVYSRENIQIMNKKLRQLKESIFASTSIEAKSPQRNNNSQIRLTGFSSLFTTFTMAAKNKRNIYSCANLRTHKDSSSPKQSQPDDTLPRASTRKTTRSTKQLSKVQAKAEVQQNKPGPSIKPNNFRATLKQKHVDDNPKVLANIIKKKVQCMKTEQVHEYIQSLMRRSKD